jgi:hypothetical protein
VSNHCRTEDFLVEGSECASEVGLGLGHGLMLFHLLSHSSLPTASAVNQTCDPVSRRGWVS